eukprot:765003-Hanusia_phi.AAC.1
MSRGKSEIYMRNGVIENRCTVYMFIEIKRPQHNGQTTTGRYTYAGDAFLPSCIFTFLLLVFPILCEQLRLDMRSELIQASDI